MKTSPWNSRYHAAALLLSFVLAPLAVFGAAPPTATKPNVIIIMTDDQGYGEIGAHGNPILKTPHLDRLHATSVRLTDFHVDPTCSPTRSALLTGRYSTRTGVWHTINGRSMMHPDELTLAEVFKANGYVTALIGKWHLGDNYPCRPEDQGFDDTVWHQGGGVDNAPAYWGNDYFDDTYEVNGSWRKFAGYCTDVWFREAIKYVEEHRAQPFFLYLTPNAPHGPYLVPDRYAVPYEAAGLPKTLARFYGMIANIDENLGRLRARLAELGLAENTLLIFLTDNGTTAGWIDQQAGFKYFNAGMRGWKGSAYDGGHRVPCFWYWPAGGLTGGREVKALTAHVDVLPTLVDLLGLQKPTGRPLDGISLRAALEGRQDSPPERTLFAHVQRAFLPPKWKDSAAMTQRWRLINGEELYDIIADPGQRTNVTADYPDVVRQLREDYERWWASLESATNQTVRYVLGGAENPMTLSSHDWLMPGVEPAAWHQNQIKNGALINGAWAVNVKQAGNYEITLSRWPPDLHRSMNVTEARLSIGGVDEHMPMNTNAASATFRVQLKPGPVMLQTWLTRPDGKQHGAYYTRVLFNNGGPNDTGAKAGSAGRESEPKSSNP
jgi:arylsulfatase A-like enzyme